MAEPSVPPPEEVKVQNPWARTVMWIAIVALFVGGGLYIFKSCVSAPGTFVGKAGQALATLAAAFNQGTVTTSFVSYATTITNYQRLQITGLKQMEIFARTEETSTAFGYISLPDVVVEARAPVEYTYYLDLNDKWQFELRDNILYVFPPSIRFNTPAVDASAISYEVKKGKFKTTEALENLKKSISSLAKLRAKENLPLVRENARRQTEEFVQNWLARSFADGKSHPIKVIFPEEKKPNEIKFVPPKESGPANEVK
jgi:hypothetical protein